MNKKELREQRASSYKGPLEQLCRRFNPASIFEWGPGPSTILMAKTCPNASITTIEHDEKYIRKWTPEFKALKNVTMHHKVISMAGGKSTGYVSSVLDHGLHELIFVDGRFRRDCLRVARAALAPGGVVVLHDCHRANYLPATKYFHHRRVWTDLRTMVMGDGPLREFGDKDA